MDLHFGEPLELHVPDLANSKKIDHAARRKDPPCRPFLHEEIAAVPGVLCEVETAQDRKLSARVNAPLSRASGEVQRAAAARDNKKPIRQRTLCALDDSRES
jgi:hypothetical protein